MIVQHGRMSFYLLPPFTSLSISSRCNPTLMASNYPFNIPSPLQAAVTLCLCFVLQPKGFQIFVSQMWQDCQKTAKAKGSSDINHSIAGSLTLSHTVYKHALLIHSLCKPNSPSKWEATHTRKSTPTPYAFFIVLVVYFFKEACHICINILQKSCKFFESW